MTEKRDRIEVTGVVDSGAATLTRGTDTTDGKTKLGMLVTIAGQPNYVLLLLDERVANDIAHLIQHGHLPND